jgi:hypothetical protein
VDGTEYHDSFLGLFPAKNIYRDPVVAISAKSVMAVLHTTLFAVILRVLWKSPFRQAGIIQQEEQGPVFYQVA